MTSAATTSVGTGSYGGKIKPKKAKHLYCDRFFISIFLETIIV